VAIGIVKRKILNLLKRIEEEIDVVMCGDRGLAQLKANVGTKLKTEADSETKQHHFVRMSKNNVLFG